MPTKINKMPFTAEELRALLDYCPETGKLTWRVKTAQNTVVGKEAGWATPRGYRRIEFKNVTYAVHRLVWLHYWGVEPKEQVDHINGIRNDNRIENLREASQQENRFNQGKYVTNKTGFKGVSWVERYKKYRAQCQVDGKNHSLGLYDTAEAASAAYVAFATKHHGEFVRTV
jgi:hypothetical protein